MPVEAAEYPDTPTRTISVAASVNQDTVGNNQVWVVGGNKYK